MKINIKIIFYFLGFLLLINGGFMFLTALLSYFYEDGITNSLLTSGVIVTVVGLLMLFLNKNHDKQINKREGYLVVVLGWLVMIFSGTIPYVLTGTIQGFSNIFFETTSGFTATGATIINNANCGFVDENNKRNNKLVCSTHPHNTYLQILSEIGIFGFLIIIYLFFTSFFTNLKILFKKNKSDLNKAYFFINLSIIINLMPLIPSGSFFNNWISLMIFFSLGFWVYVKDKTKQYRAET